MKSLRASFIILLMLLYGYVFILQEKHAQFKDITLENPIPVSLYRVASGYGRQLAAEMLFIKTAVFLGEVKQKAPNTSYASALENNFDAITSLYPRFIDPYYFSQAYLPSLSRDAAEKNNNILDTGITAFPKDFAFRLFKAINFILYLNEPLESARSFAETAAIADAPPLFGHLAAVFSAQGGDIVAGLISLKALLASEKDKGVRSRYQKEIAIFEQAVQVNDALIAYQKKNNAPPDDLNQLVPEFIPAIPEIKDTFILVYNKPLLRLVRPTPLK